MAFRYASFQCPDSGICVTVTNQGGWRSYVDDEYLEERAATAIDPVSAREWAESIAATYKWCERVNNALRRLHDRGDVENVLVDRFGCEPDDLNPLTW